jgi:hypothetical protein
MSSSDEVAHRHLLSVDGLRASHESDAQYVRVVMEDAWAASRAGQLLASCLVNLLVRQVKLVRGVEVLAPSTPCLIRLPYGSSAEVFPGCLQPLAGWAADGAVTVTTIITGTRADQTIRIGAPRADINAAQEEPICVLGDGWRAWAGAPSHALQGISPKSSNPLGPFLAATLVAGEVFKRGRGLRRGRYLTGDGYSLWSDRAEPDWHALEAGPDVAGLTLPPVHIAGLGAVGNALAYVIANLGLAGAYLVLIDDDCYDITNLNRCLLAGWQDQGEAKVKAVARALHDAGLGVYPYAGTVKIYVADARTGLRSDVARAVDDLDFQIVTSCVDKGISRHDVQGLWPKLLLGASTVNLQAKCNRYNAWRGAACLACFNPAERYGEKIRALEDQLRSMSSGERKQFLSRNGLEAKAVEEYLSGAPCGGLGETALKDFATRPPPQFSAGFTSLAAGVLLAAALLRATAFASSACPSSDMVTVNFLNGGLIATGFGADDACGMQHHGSPPPSLLARLY